MPRRGPRAPPTSLARRRRAMPRRRGRCRPPPSASRSADAARPRSPSCKPPGRPRRGRAAARTSCDASRSCAARSARRRATSRPPPPTARGAAPGRRGTRSPGRSHGAPRGRPPSRRRCPHDCQGRENDGARVLRGAPSPTPFSCVRSTGRPRRDACLPIRLRRCTMQTDAMSPEDARDAVGARVRQEEIVWSSATARWPRSTMRSITSEGVPAACS